MDESQRRRPPRAAAPGICARGRAPAAGGAASGWTAINRAVLILYGSNDRGYLTDKGMLADCTRTVALSPSSSSRSLCQVPRLASPLAPLLCPRPCHATAQAALSSSSSCLPPVQAAHSPRLQALSPTKPLPRSFLGAPGSPRHRRRLLLRPWTAPRVRHPSRLSLPAPPPPLPLVTIPISRPLLFVLGPLRSILLLFPLLVLRRRPLQSPSTSAQEARSRRKQHR